MKNQDQVFIFDTTLRDGEQAPGASMNEKEKLEIALALERLGVDIIEAGFPVISQGDFNSVKNVAQNIHASIVCGLARSIPKDIDACAQAIKVAQRPRIHVFLATSKIHLEHKLKRSKEEILKMAVDAVTYARDKIEDIEFSPEDASRTERDFLFRIIESVIAAGARTVNIPDTVGYGVPSQFGQLIKDIKNNVPNINKAVISVHCHNDLGLAVANSLEAIKHGARQVECTINGIGERAGNASMEEIVMNLKTRMDYYECDTNIKTQEICRVSRLVSKYSGFVIAPNKAIVGANAFRHEAGIHQDGVLKERTTYEIMRPEDVGFIETGLVLGKHSGRHAFRVRLQSLGVQLDEQALGQAFDRFKDVADKKKEVYDEDLLAIVEDEIRLVSEIWQLKSLKVASGTKMASRATVILTSKGKSHKKSSTGDGPVDACYKAVEQVVKMKGELLDYAIQSVTRGKDALGEVTVKVKIKDKVFIGRGTSTDIIEASAKAYVTAINKNIAHHDK